MGRHITYTTEAILEALQLTGGNLNQAAKHLGAAYFTLYKRAKDDRAIRRAIKRERRRMVDMAEYHLRKAMESEHPDQKDVHFVLKTLGKNRGYSEKQELEHTGSGGGPISLMPFDPRHLTEEEQEIILKADAIYRRELPEADTLDEAGDSASSGEAEPSRNGHPVEPGEIPEPPTHPTD